MPALVGPVVDHPVGLPAQRVEHVEPAPVAGREHVEQRVEQRERLVVLLALSAWRSASRSASTASASPTSAERTK